eukprot:1754231-Rhodomonas_salina.2
MQATGTSTSSTTVSSSASLRPSFPRTSASQVPGLIALSETKYEEEKQCRTQTLRIVFHFVRGIRHRRKRHSWHQSLSSCDFNALVQQRTIIGRHRTVLTQRRTVLPGSPFAIRETLMLAAESFSEVTGTDWKVMGSEAKVTGSKSSQDLAEVDNRMHDLRWKHWIPLNRISNIMARDPVEPNVSG